MASGDSNILKMWEREGQTKTITDNLMGPEQLALTMDLNKTENQHGGRQLKKWERPTTP